MTHVLRRTATLAVACGVFACAPAPEAGVADPDLFRASANGPVITSTRPAAEVAACFEARATLLPTSTVADDPETGGRVYRLRAVGRTYEEIRFLPAQGGGSTAEVLIATNLRPSWRKGFDRDRGAVLDACASGEAR
jgi:hypothetical protein